MLVLLIGLTVLVALLLPVLQAAEVTGRELSCREQLRATGTWIEAYAADHDGRRPPAADAVRYPAEVFAHPGFDRRALLASYADARGLPACPATEAGRPGDAGNTAPVLYETYAWVGAADTRADGTRNPAEAARVQDVLIDAERGLGGFGQRYNHGEGKAATRDGNPAFGGFWGGDPAGLNVMFADGHAAWFGTGDVGVAGWATGQRQRRVYGVVEAAKFEVRSSKSEAAGGAGYADAMPLIQIDIEPDFTAVTAAHDALMADANRRIEDFVRRRKDAPIPAFVPSDARMSVAALATIQRDHLAPQNTFCEWGSGMGVTACLAAQLGFDACGIEIERDLVEASAPTWRRTTD